MKNIRYTIQAKVHCPSRRSHNLKATNIGFTKISFSGFLIPTLAADRVFNQDDNPLIFLAKEDDMSNHATDLILQPLRRV